MTTATIEDTTITMLWGDSRGFERRVRAYSERTGAHISMVIPMRNVPYETIMERAE